MNKIAFQHGFDSPVFEGLEIKEVSENLSVIIISETFRYYRLFISCVLHNFYAFKSCTLGYVSFYKL